MKKHSFNISRLVCTMKARFFFLFGIGLILMVVATACTKLEKEETVLPEDPFDRPVGNLFLESDTSGKARLSLSKLYLDRSKPFSLVARNFQHGVFDLLGDSELVFRATETKTWKADSGTIVLSQNSKTKTGFVRILNKAYPKPSWTVVWPQGTPVPDMAPIYLDFFDSRNLTNLIGMEETGSEIDSIWGFIYSATIKPDKRTLVYAANGGLGNFLNFGTDHIYYRIKRPNGLYFRGMIPVFIGDTSRPMARPDDLNLIGTEGFVLWSTLMANDLSTANEPPQSPAILRLEPLPYTGSRKINARFGTWQDSSQNGIPAFFYKRFASGNQPDTSFIFLEEGSDQRITRSRLIITPN